jgi:6-phosphogluconate dehydrogenase
MHELGIIGLGKMGGNIARRLLQAGLRVVAFDPSAPKRAPLVAAGAVEATTVAALVAQLAAPRAVWVMVPAGAPTEAVLEELGAHLAPGDLVVDGGNSFYRDSMRRARHLAESGILMLDVGTSGGIWGLENGYCLMVGGETAAVNRLRPVFEALAPAADQGWAQVGPSGAGHFVKMIHNGIEYGMMQALAEGFALLHEKQELALDPLQVARLWQHGSVIRSWLLDLTAAALTAYPDLEGLAPFVQDSGEGRWTVQEAIDLEVSAPVITLSLLERLRSRTDNAYADRLLAALRQQFGGHTVKQEL